LGGAIFQEQARHFEKALPFGDPSEDAAKRLVRSPPRLKQLGVGRRLSLRGHNRSAWEGYAAKAGGGGRDLLRGVKGAGLGVEVAQLVANPGHQGVVLAHLAEGFVPVQQIDMGFTMRAVCPPASPL
jgi:hypothetical protein